MTEERDPKVSQRYRELSGDKPSHELDRNILAAARRATDNPHAPLLTPAGRHRWYFSLAAAAVLALAVAVTLHVERQQPDPELSVPPPPSPQVQQAAKPEPVPQAVPSPARKPAPMARAERQRAYAPDPAPPPPAAEMRASPEDAGERRRESARADVASAQSQAAPVPQSRVA